MTDLTLFLEDRRHVPCVGDLMASFLRREVRRRHGDQSHHSTRNTAQERAADSCLCHESNLSFHFHGLTDTATKPLDQQH